MKTNTNIKYYMLLLIFFYTDETKIIQQRLPKTSFQKILQTTSPHNRRNFYK